MKMTIYINCSKNFSPTASMWGNALRHSAWNFAARDTFSLYLNLSKDLVPIVFSWLFSKGSVQYNLPHASESFVPNVKSTFHGRESLSYLGPKIWDLTFKKAIKKWKLQNYPCRVFKNTFKISVLFDTFSETLDKGLLSNFITFVRLIGSNRLVHEIIKKPDYLRRNEDRLILSDWLDDGGEIWRQFQRFFIFLIFML